MYNQVPTRKEHIEIEYYKLQFLKEAVKQKPIIDKQKQKPRYESIRPTFCSLETRSRHGKKKLTARSKTGVGGEGKV
ncbi:hypothetical protein D8674_029241 [Pyrus ussuriensis x Pyrus communis]|uniref:Uncharacterized protein n=1 Tax=Pyrus ussuriensis x Pyrus communis TaxID=2448454 RepID=A0A5N5IC30_9ROSA|nr:hypothetical protein D8674_029241 [Pyrus ussuriensis x Pyrus communis]